MKSKKPPSSLYFEVQSEMGSTKHMGGRAATDEILKLCRIKSGMNVLEVGCGAGITSRYVAKEYNVKVTAIDINKKMVKKAKERSKGTANLEYAVADAQKLPFKDNSFDIVFCQSVLAFVPNKQKAVNEFKRVVKKGGYIALNEATWKTDPPQKLQDYLSMTVGDAKFLKKEEYVKLLKNAGLKEISAQIHDLNMLTEMRENMRRFNLRDYIHAWYVLIRGLFTSTKFRKFTWDAIRMAGVAKDIFKYWQYGFYVGKKA
jgi:ubiquinone/menaquinone biosynthesis C-methylase UbiE